MARVIIVDDEAMFRSLMSGMLRRAGHEATAFDNAEAALAHFETAGADLFITDVFMPGKEGLETIREIRRRWPTLAIMAVSGGGSGQFGAPGDVLSFAQSFGATAVLTKPFRAEVFLAAVGDALNDGAPRATPGMADTQASA